MKLPRLLIKKQQKSFRKMQGNSRHFRTGKINIDLYISIILMNLIIKDLLTFFDSEAKISFKYRKMKRIKQNDHHIKFFSKFSRFRSNVLKWAQFVKSSKVLPKKDRYRATIRRRVNYKEKKLLLIYRM